MVVTAEEWLACADATPMLEFLRGKASDRKLRLFAAACCRSAWTYLTTHRSRTAVEVAERFADGQATNAELVRVYEMALDAAHKAQQRGSRRRFGHLLLRSEAKLFYAGQTAHLHKPFLVGRLSWVGRDEDIKSISPNLLRDIFGNPFRPSPPLPAAVLAWNDATVPRIAQAIYDERQMPQGTLDAGHLAILADALLDAGCEDEALIGHCREPGPHVRGCWTLDMILGKE
jgi:hypothetical protein